MNAGMQSNMRGWRSGRNHENSRRRTGKMNIIRVALLRLFVSWWCIPLVWLVFWPLNWLLFGDRDYATRVACEVTKSIRWSE